MDDLETREEPDSRFREWLALFLRGKWIILATTALGVGGMVWQTMRTKPVYEASALVLINPKPGQAANPLGGAMMEELGPSSKVANEIAILRTRGLSDAVAAVLLQQPYLDTASKTLFPCVQEWSESAPTGKLQSLDKVSAKLRGQVDFSPERESDIVRIRAKSNNRFEAAAIANTYAEAYQEYALRQSRSRSSSIRQFLEKRLQEQGDSLQRAEGQMRAFMESSGIVTLDDESRRVVAELAELEAKQNSLLLDIQTGEQRLAALERDLPRQETALAGAISQATDSYIRELQVQLGKLEAQRDLITASNDQAVLRQPQYQQKLKDLDSQIGVLRERLRQRSAEVIQALFSGEGMAMQGDAIGFVGGLKKDMIETKFKLETDKARYAALSASITQYDSRFKQIPRQSIEFARRQRDRMSSEKLHTLVEEKFNEAVIAEKSEFGYVSIIDQAYVPGGPVSPNPQRNMLMGLLMGLASGLGLVLLRDMLDVRARTPEQLRRKGYVTISEVPPMGKDIKRAKKDNRIPKEARKLHPTMWPIFDPFSMLAESYRRLRTTLLRARLDTPLKVVMVTSANPSEGKTTTATNLAATFAETQKRVLLIDADIRRPRIHKILGQQARAGLCELVNDRLEVDKIIQRNVLENLDFISSGNGAAAPSKVFASEAMKSVVDMARDKYDLVVVDVPPVLVVNDAAILSGLVDGTVLVAAAGSTRIAALDKAREILEASGGHVLGVVLNNFDARRAYGRYYGGYHYGHYGSYKGYVSTDGKESKRESGVFDRL